MDNIYAGVQKDYGTKRKSKEEFEAIKAERLAKQNNDLDIISDIAKFLNDFVENNTSYNHRATVRGVIDHLNTEKNYDVELTKLVSQYIYLMVDLANARNNKFITPDRCNIRVSYVLERFHTAFKIELHDRIDEIVKSNPSLFFIEVRENYYELCLEK